LPESDVLLLLLVLVTLLGIGIEVIKLIIDLIKKNRSV